MPDEPITFDKTRLFRPVSIRWPHWGFLGGPFAYEATDDAGAEPRIMEADADVVKLILEENR